MNQQEQHYLVNNTRLNIRLIEENATELIPLIGKHPELFQAVCRIMDANRAPKIIVRTMPNPISFETAGPVTADQTMNQQPMQAQTQQAEPAPTKFASFNERKEFLGFYDGESTPLGHQLGIYLTPAQMKKSEQPGASARLFNKPGYGGWQITMSAPKKATSPAVPRVAFEDNPNRGSFEYETTDNPQSREEWLAAQAPAPAPAVAYFAAYTENETTRSQVGTYGSHSEAMQAAKEAVKADKKRMPREHFTPLIIELAPDSPAALAAANIAHETAVIDAVAELGDMTWSDAQGFVDFGSFDYMQCLTKGLTPAETAKVLLKVTSPAPPTDSIISLPDTLRTYGRNIKETENPDQTIQSLVYVGASTQSLKNGELYSVRVTASGSAVWVQGIFGRTKATKFSSLQSFMNNWQPAAEQPHQIGQPITQAPDLNAFAKLVTLAMAQMEREALTSPAVAQEDTTALLVEHQGDEYAAADNDEQPDELIRARHGEPAPVLAPRPMSKRKFPFTALRLAGHAVRILHQVGKCAVARVFPCEGRAPYYAARFRQHTVQFGHLHEAEQALLTLRGLDNAEIRRDNEVFTVIDALEQLDLSPPCLDHFCAHHGLDADRSYKRRELRRAITDKREPKMPVYLSLLNKLTVTTPATK